MSKFRERIDMMGPEHMFANWFVLADEMDLYIDKIEPSIFRVIRAIERRPDIEALLGFDERCIIHEVKHLLRPKP